MEAIEFNSVVKNGMIPIPEIYRKKVNSSVRVIVLVNDHAIDAEDRSVAVDFFLKNWSGILSEKSEEEIENARYEYLMEKYNYQRAIFRLD
jgi:3'-phosphoadenosine 5'-phosphosulfate sulfotransferase